MGRFIDGTTVSLVFLELIFLSFISDVQNNLAELSCNVSEYASMLSGIPNDSGSTTSKCRTHIEETILITPNDLGANYTANSKHFMILCSEGCLPHAARIAKYCLRNLEPILSLGCSNNSESMCWTIPSTEMGTNISEKCYSNSTNGTCSSECKTELGRVLNSTECCFGNVFDSGLFGTTFSSANATLLNACQLQKPSACPVPSEITNAQRLPTTTGASPVTISGQQLLSLTALWTLFVIMSLSCIMS